VAGLALFSIGTFLFWPAAIAGRYSYFLIALFVIASGLSFLETAANPFIAQLGDPSSAARRLNLAQAFNPFGAISGVLIGTLFIFSGVELQPQQVAALQAQHAYTAYLRSETMRVVSPYLVLGGLAVVILILIALTKFPASLTQTEDSSSGAGSFRALFQYPHFLFAVIAQFFYVGAQVGTWSYFISYVQSYTHEPEKMAGYLLTATLVAFGVGRFSSAWLMRYVSPGKLMGIFSVTNMALAAIGVFFPAHQLLHVPHVPHHLRVRPARTGREHQGRRLHDRHGHRRRRCSHADHGPHLGEIGQHCPGLHRSTVSLRGHRAVLVL
jgi:FHS family L-fucose permease-like MFS transporter